MEESEYVNYAKGLETRNQALETERTELQNKYGQLSSFMPKQEQNLIEYQLDLKEELDRIQHLLAGHVLALDGNGNEVWIEPTDDRLKIFSDYGVKQIMNIISFYINRNTLLSYYSDDEIYWKVNDFGNALADLIFDRYEHFFYYPTPEELYDKYKEIVAKQNLDITEQELYEKCLQWSEEELASKTRHYPMTIIALCDSVHSTFQRAYGGKERDSLRKFSHVSQSINPTGEVYSPQNQGVAKHKKW